MSHSIRPFSDEEYCVLVLLGLKRMLKRSDWHLAFIPPRSPMDDNPTHTEVSSAIDCAIAAMREKLTGEHGQEGE